MEVKRKGKNKLERERETRGNDIRRISNSLTQQFHYST